MSDNYLQVAVGLVIDQQGRWLLTQRARHKHQGGLWEFPGGKLEVGEQAFAALQRELDEEVGLQVHAGEPLIQIRHAYPNLKVLLDVWRVTSYSGEAHAREGQGLAWVAPDQLERFPLPEANLNIVKAAQLPQTYPILEGAEAEALLLQAQRLASSGVPLLQFRAKNLPSQARRDVFDRVADLCRQSGVTLMVNSDLDLPIAPDQGLHLSSRQLAQCHEKPAGLRWVAASCHDLDELQRAQALELDFAVLAPILPTPTHPDAPHLGWTILQDWLRQVNIPVYGLGGLSRADLPRMLSAGAQGLAGIRAFQ